MALTIARQSKNHADSSLLGCSKAEILGFVREHKILFREDATNISNDFLRNRIRNELLPLLRKNYQPGIAKTVLRLMEIIGAEADVIGQLAGNWLSQRQPDFENLPVAVQRRVLQLQLTRLNVSSDFELIETLRRDANIVVSVDANFSISRNAAGDIKLRHDYEEAVFKPDELALNLTGRVGGVDFGGVILNWRFDMRTGGLLPVKKSGCEHFDAAKVGNKIILLALAAG